MNNECITPRETMDIHEIVMFKVLCATKAVALKALVQDEELKSLLQLDITTTKEHLKELLGLLNTSPLNKEENV
jgi:similar to spore coat protein